MMDSYCEEILKLLQDNDQTIAVEKAKEHLENINNVPLTIAITGETGAGKSTFINALRGLKNSEEGAAPTGVVETTMKPTEYVHPHHPNIKIWDLPGIGSVKMKADKYLKNVGFEKFDFFIIVSDTRFRENDAKLSQEIQKMEKKFYFVRSKIDHNISDEARSKGVKELNEEMKKSTLDLIRKNCLEELENLGLQSPKVFLVSSFDLDLYDFKDLWDTLEKELPQHQRDALLLSLPNINLDVINKKKEVLNAQIIWFALASAAGAAVPVPGLSTPIDIAIIVCFAKKCQISLGLTHESLLKFSQDKKFKMEDVKALFKSPLAGVIITGELVFKVLAMSVALIAAAVAEEGARFIPLIGIPIAMALSFTTTYNMLRFILKTMAEDAQRAFMKSLEVSSSK